MLCGARAVEVEIIVMMPLTRNNISAHREADIRERVRGVVGLEGFFRLAGRDDAAALTDFLSDPAVSQPIYTLPEKINDTTIGDFIEEHLQEKDRGEGFLMIGHQSEGFVEAYYDFQLWPQWAVGKLGGAIHPRLQNSGRGGSDAQRIFSWMFDYLDIDLICETCALDNTRSARLLERIGFTLKGEVLSELPTGGTRPSLYWELGR